MAPTSAAKAEREKKVKDILSITSQLIRLAETSAYERAGFASKVPNSTKGSTIDPSLANDLRTRIHGLPITTGSARMQELDAAGTELWNLATRLNREPNASEYKRSLCLLRVFAFFLLDSGHSDRVGSLSNRSRLLKVAFKSAKACLAQQELEFSVKILERAAHYVDMNDQHDKDIGAEDALICERLTAEYFVLRTTMAWKQSKLDVAEHMFKKASDAHLLFDPTACEEFADTLYEIGKDLASRKQHELAMKWLGRALDVLSEQDLEHLSDDASELKMATMHLLVKSLLAMRTDEAKKKAQDLVSLMENDYAEKMVVSLLKLEILASDQSPDPEASYAVLLRMIRSSILTRENFKTLMHHLHKLRKLSPKLTCKALDELLSLRLLENGKEEWIERATIMRIWITTTQGNGEEMVTELTELLDQVLHSIKNPLNAPATHAAQTLIWKHIETAFEAKEYDASLSWCHLALHPLFEKGGDFNKAKIGRKAMLCALAEQNFARARQAFFAMPESGQSAPESQYLMYKLALRSGDTELAASSLDAVSNRSDKDATLLYACVLEAMQTGEKQQAIAALKKVLEKYDYKAPKGVHLPALLRCSIRLLKSMFDSDPEHREALMGELCRLFRAALSHAKPSSTKDQRSTDHDFTRIECEWFVRNAYNLLLESLTRSHPTHLLQLSNVTIDLVKVIQQSVKGTEQEQDKDLETLSICQLECQYVAIVAHSILGRSEVNREASLQHYTEVCDHGSNFYDKIIHYLDNATENNPGTLKFSSQCHEILLYELEAVLHLRRWSDLNTIFTRCLQHRTADSPDLPAKYMAKYADLALLIHEELTKANQATSHGQPVLQFLQSLINKAYSSKPDVKTLCKWIRCLFQLSLKSNDSLAIQCLDQAIKIARKCREAKTPFDAVELEWLAATTFNRAVDFYSAGDEKGCRVWAETALRLAGEASDGGALLKVLREKYGTLSFEGES